MSLAYIILWTAHNCCEGLDHLAEIYKQGVQLMYFNWYAYPKDILSMCWPSRDEGLDGEKGDWQLMVPKGF